MMEIHTLGTSTTDKPLYSAKNNQNNQGEENHEGIKHFVFTCFSQTVSCFQAALGTKTSN